jgi:hypothetical protein
VLLVALGVRPLLVEDENADHCTSSSWTERRAYSLPPCPEAPHLPSR